jgi:hypothetical protein
MNSQIVGLHIVNVIQANVCNAIGAVSDAPGNPCGWPSDAVVTKRAGCPLLGWLEQLDVETFPLTNKMRWTRRPKCLIR